MNIDQIEALYQAEAKAFEDITLGTTSVDEVVKAIGALRTALWNNWPALRDELRRLQELLHTQADYFEGEMRKKYPELDAIKHDLSRCVERETEYLNLSERQRDAIEKAREKLYALIEYAGDSNECQYGTLATDLVRDLASGALAALDEPARKANIPEGEE
jgi:hypothetical protein